MLTSYQPSLLVIDVKKDAGSPDTGVVTSREAPIESTRTGDSPVIGGPAIACSAPAVVVSVVAPRSSGGATAGASPSRRTSRDATGVVYRHRIGERRQNVQCTVPP